MNLRVESGASHPAPYVSVVIATKNRAAELGSISLPSLARQNGDDFEILVWDASDGEDSRAAVEAFAAAHPQRNVRYQRAPRPGLARQRNDAARTAQGEILFFIDDDSEVLADGIATLAALFQSEPRPGAGALPLTNRIGGREMQAKRSFSLLDLYTHVFFTSGRWSGTYPFVPPAHPGPADHLWGCDMAYRKDLFLALGGIDERLQRFAGYSFGEDQLLSHRVWRLGHPVLVAPVSGVIHHTAEGARVGREFHQGRVDGYNVSIVWRASIFPYAPWTLPLFLWARLGFLGVVLLPCLVQFWQKRRWLRLAGYLSGCWAFLAEEIFPKAPTS